MNDESICVFKIKKNFVSTVFGFKSRFKILRKNFLNPHPGFKIQDSAKNFLNPNPGFKIQHSGRNYFIDIQMYLYIHRFF